MADEEAEKDARVTRRGDEAGDEMYSFYRCWSDCFASFMASDALWKGQIAADEMCSVGGMVGRLGLKGFAAGSGLSANRCSSEVI